MGWWYAPPPPSQPPLPPKSSGAQAWGNAPPTPIGPGAVLAALRSTWPVEQWPVQSSATVASQLANTLPAPPFPVPFPNAALQETIRAAWPAESWPSQVLEGGGVGALTANPFVPPVPIFSSNAANRVILQAAWSPPESWPAQHGTNIAGILATPVNPPVIFPAAPMAVRLSILHSWPQEMWRAQSEPGIAAGLAQLQIPPIYIPSSRVPVFTGILRAWPQEDWAAQAGARGAGGWFVPTAIYTPSPVRHLEYLIWPQPDWPAQRGANIASLFATGVAPLPWINRALQNQLLASWPQEMWAAQRAAALVPGFATPPPTYPYNNLPLFYSVRSAWPQEWWDYQTQAPAGGITAGPFVPPIGPLILSEAIYIIVNANLLVAVPFIYEASDTIPPGYVIATIPPAGTQLPIWTPVTIVVSGGPAYAFGDVQVGDYGGFTAQVARDQIYAANLSLNSYRWQVSNDLAGNVIDQFPPPNVFVVPGTLVQLTLSLGPPQPPLPTPPVPSGP